MTLTPSSFVSPEQAPLVSGVEKINLDEKTYSTTFPSLLALGGLRGRNPLLVVSSVTPGGFSPKLEFDCFSFGIALHHA